MFGLEMYFFCHNVEDFLETVLFLIWFYCKKLRKFILAVKLPTHAHIGKGTSAIFNVEAKNYETFKNPFYATS